MTSRKDPEEQQRIERRRHHYEVEKELAYRLKRASKNERKTLYTALYDELYRRVPYHPQLVQKQSLETQRRAVTAQMRILSRFLTPDGTFLELGPGDCLLSVEVARHVKKVYAIDVSTEITKCASKPGNFELIISDGSSVDVPAGSVNVAYSNQLMEHLHPDDAADQLAGVYRALAPGGVFVCITPHRFSGPHDISKYFDETASGFHLKEYTSTELYRMLKSAGFRRVRTYVGMRGMGAVLPVGPILALESVLERLPRRMRKAFAKLFFSSIRGEDLGNRIIAVK
jgi:ubiquinone/menaquinone biosynthesis C-methylase UbiE